MKITIEVPEKHINGALLEPRSRYWADEAGWDPVEKNGFVIVRDTGVRYQVSETSIQSALVWLSLNKPLIFYELLSGRYDSETGDILLQAMAFGKLRYG